MLPNFNECWWDSIILDVFCCNWIGKPQCHGVSGSFLHRNFVKWMKSHDDNSVSSAIAILPSCLPPRDLASTSIYIILQKGTNLLQIYHILCLKWTIFFIVGCVMFLSFLRWGHVFQLLLPIQVSTCWRSDWTGIWAGMKTVKYFDGKTYAWVGLSQQKSIFGKVCIFLGAYFHPISQLH